MAAPLLPPDRPAALRLVFPLDLVSARAAAAAVRSFFAEQGLSEAELFDCELCATEGCKNAVDHATGPRRKLPASIEALCSDSQLELRVIDHTAGFRWPKRFAKPPLHAERGRGLFIIRSFMDEVVYLRGGEENVLVMRRKRRGPPRPHAAESAGLTFEESKRQLADSQRAVSAMTRELRFRSETLAAVFRCCAELGRADSSEGFEQRLLADMMHLTSADWYVLRLVSPDQRQLAIAAVSESGLETHEVLLPGDGEKPTSIEAQVAALRVPVLFKTRDCAATEPLRVVGETANGVVFPLFFNDSLVGTVAVGRRQGDFVFDDLHEEVGRTFAEFLAIQKAGLRYREENLRTKLFDNELDIARVIQRSLLPVALPQIPGFGLVGGWHSARQVGGDFYDAIALSEHTSLLIIADVMGKGIPAALFATNLRGSLRSLAARFDDPAYLLSRLNRLLYYELSAVSMFITVQVAVVDLFKRSITAAGAGHCPLLYAKAGEETVGLLATQGMPIGVLPDIEYRSQTVTLDGPFTLLMHTDGLTDTRNVAGESFGQPRLAEWLRANHGRRRSATELRGRLTSELTRFRGDAAMTDDQAFLLLTEEHVEDPRDTDAILPSVRGKRDALVQPRC